MVSAQFSLAYGVALCLVRRSNTVADYANPSLWQHKDMLSMIDKVRTHVVTLGPDESDNGAVVTVKLKGGRVLKHHQRVTAGRRLREVWKRLKRYFGSSRHWSPARVFAPCSIA
jgi:2-methylcitrate dehydratase PrpD